MPETETDAQRLERIQRWGYLNGGALRIGPEDAAWLLAQAAEAQALRAALEDAGNQHCGWCFLSPFDKCERPECPGAPARRALERKP